MIYEYYVLDYTEVYRINLESILVPKPYKLNKNTKKWKKSKMDLDALELSGTVIAESDVEAIIALSNIS